MAAPFPEAARAGAGIRAPVGARFELQWIASVTTTLQVALLIEHDDNSSSPFTLEDAHAGDRTVELVPIPGGQLQKAGTVRALTANFADAAGVKRGQAYVLLRMVYAGRTFRIARGYAYDGHPVGLGEDVEPGPGGGEGFRSWVSLAADIAPVDLLRVLAAANAYRRIHGYAWYYNAAAVAATRTLDVAFRRPGLAVPTGFTGQGVVWQALTTTLTTGEEGLNFANSRMSISNDNGTISIGNITTAPNPFPYDAEENDLAEMNFDVLAAEATDRHSIYLDQEEWLMI